VTGQTADGNRSEIADRLTSHVDAVAGGTTNCLTFENRIATRTKKSIQQPRRLLNTDASFLVLGSADFTWALYSRAALANATKLTSRRFFATKSYKRSRLQCRVDADTRDEYCNNLERWDSAAWLDTMYIGYCWTFIDRRQRARGIWSYVWWNADTTPDTCPELSNGPDLQTESSDKLSQIVSSPQVEGNRHFSGYDVIWQPITRNFDNQTAHGQRCSADLSRSTRPGFAIRVGQQVAACRILCVQLLRFATSWGWQTDTDAIRTDSVWLAQLRYGQLSWNVTEMVTVLQSSLCYGLTLLRCFMNCNDICHWKLLTLSFSLLV